MVGVQDLASEESGTCFFSKHFASFIFPIGVQRF
jgi:hypothetical protein